MISNNKIFYKCLGYKNTKNIKKPIFFFHVPKCAGTTFAVLISHLLKKTHRINGALFNNNDKGGLTAYENYLKNEKLINNNNLDFLYGHVPFEIYNKLKKEYLFVTTLREPIERCVSHYNWGINRGYYSIKESLEDLFINNMIPKNAIVNQFSGIGLSNPNNKKSIDLSFNNLKNKIDLIYDSKEISYLLNLIISKYNLPNLFFQKQQVNLNKNEISEKNLNIIKNYNELDLILYKKLFENNIINNKNINHEKRTVQTYLYSSPEILLDKQKTIIINEKKLKIIENQLLKSKYNIKII